MHSPFQKEKLLKIFDNFICPELRESVEKYSKDIIWKNRNCDIELGQRYQ